MPKYIDAEKFAEHISGNLSWNGEQYNAASVISDLKIFPAADVEPVRHGRWVDYDDTEHFTARCNLCGDVIDTRFAMHFCPHCGAKMVAEPPKEETVNEITPEMIEAAERNEKRIKERVDKLYDELIAEKRAEIERLEAEIAKMPPPDYKKLVANPPVYPANNGGCCGD